MSQNRPFTIFDCEQRSPEWFEARRGLVTGSKAKIVFMKTGTAGRNDYILQLALERLCGVVEPEPYFGPEMRRGVEMEGPTRIATEARYGVIIRETGFCRHNSLPIGMSFDGDIEDFSSFVEFKCPKSTTHIRYMEEKVLPAQYKPQIMHGHLVSGAKYSIFGSGDNRLPPGLDLFNVEINVNDLPMEEYEKALMKFLGEVEDMEIQLKLMQKGKWK